MVKILVCPPVPTPLYGNYGRGWTLFGILSKCNVGFSLLRGLIGDFNRWVQFFLFSTQQWSAHSYEKKKFQNWWVQLHPLIQPNEDLTLHEILAVHSDHVIQRKKTSVIHAPFNRVNSSIKYVRMYKFMGIFYLGAPSSIIPVRTQRKGLDRYIKIKALM